MDNQLPRGIWYEKKRDRYRVRLYHNKQVFRAGYFKSRNEALIAYDATKREIQKRRALRRTPQPIGSIAYFNQTAQKARRSINTQQLPQGIPQ